MSRHPSEFPKLGTPDGDRRSQIYKELNYIEKMADKFGFSSEL